MAAANRFQNDAEIEALVAAFRSRRLPKAAWTHQAHLATGGANTATAGYHETITQFYLTIIEDFRRGFPAEASLVERVNAVITTLGDRRLPTRHYSEGLLWSPAARAQWVEPDLLPLPAVEPGPAGPP